MFLPARCMIASQSGEFGGVEWLASVPLHLSLAGRPPHQRKRLVSWLRRARVSAVPNRPDAPLMITRIAGHAFRN